MAFFPENWEAERLQADLGAAGLGAVGLGALDPPYSTSELVASGQGDSGVEDSGLEDSDPGPSFLVVAGLVASHQKVPCLVEDGVRLVASDFGSSADSGSSGSQLADYKSVHLSFDPHDVVRF